jgi:hypothetical protein
MKIFGDNMFGLKMAPVIFGTLMVPAAYLAAWRAFDCHRVAAITAALLATNVPHIHFSRHIMNVDPWAIFTVCLFFIAHGIRTYAAWAFGAAGLFFMFSLHTYLSGRVLCFVIPLFFLFMLWDPSRRRSSLWQGILFFVLGAFVFIGPNAVNILLDPHAWKESNRPGATFLIIKNLVDFASFAQVETIPQFIANRFWTVMRLLYTRDSSTQSPVVFPFFNLCLTPFFWLGLGVAIFEIKRNPIQLLLVLLLTLSVILGIAIVPVATYWPKLLCITLIGAIFIARGCLGLFNALVGFFLPAGKHIWGNQSRFARLGIIIPQLAIIAFFSVLGVNNWNLYRPAAEKDDFLASVLGRYVASLPHGTKVCGMSERNTHLDLGEMPVLLLANNQELRPFTPKNPDALLADCGAPPFVWIIGDNQLDLKEAAVRAFPRGRLEEQYWSTGGRAFFSFTAAS